MEQRKRLPLSSDIVFKRVFSREENKHLLKSVLEAILKIEIEDIEIKNPNIIPNVADKKAGVMDIKAYVNQSIIVDIEMQVSNITNYIERNTYYLVDIAQEALYRGTDYAKHKKAIAITILNENIIKRNSFFSKAHMKFEPYDNETYVDMGFADEEEIVTDKLEMNFIELKKFIQRNPEKQTLLNQWLWLISGMEDKIKMEEKNKEIEKAEEIIDEMSMNPEEWEIYNARRRAIMNYNTDIILAKEEGIELGKIEGKIEGEKEKAIDIARKLVELKLSIEEIVKITGLTKEEVENLKEK